MDCAGCAMHKGLYQHLGAPGHLVTEILEQITGFRIVVIEHVPN